MFVFFFFKQKTAYEMLRSLVGSEMCIRDRPAAFAALKDAFTSLDGAIETLEDLCVQPLQKASSLMGEAANKTAEAAEIIKTGKAIANDPVGGAMGAVSDVLGTEGINIGW
eukprot:TRINITY_DN18856_c0_g1_i5.p1 TRINITY_DN18856_c0_g1~~TRINITY_DN18856_c0_g1_i5.p1  ORF type:complete len:111 (+),score=49.25 TRINITY_DN18856_c0_g1_i5:92-424(+)